MIFQKKKIIKWTLIIFSVLSILTLSVILYFASVDLAPNTESIIIKYYKKNILIQVKEIEYKGNSYRYLKLSRSLKKNYLLCIVQGAPMTLSDFSNYFEDSTITSLYDIIMPERLGYGKNKSDTAVPDITKQAEYIDYLLDKEVIADQKIIFLSHSYGGAIASVASYMMDSLVKAHILLAPVIDPDHEKIFWFSSLPIQFPIKFIASNQLKSASIEKMNHADALRNVALLFSKIYSKVFHFHGTDDFLAPKENIDFVNKTFPPYILEQKIIPGGGHFIDFKLVKEKLIKIAGD